MDRLGKLVDLVNNAIKYGRGKPIAVAAKLDGLKVRIEVRDHGIVDAHGGSIGVRSAAGSGATFVVELPVEQRPQERTPARA